MSDFQEIPVTELQFNPFTMISKEWMLVSAGSAQQCNTMTASWGGLGVLWDKCVAFCFVRPSRYTFEFMEDNRSYSLSFFDETYRRVLDYCGSHSGRHVNKIERCGITPVEGSIGDVYFEEARLVIECRKLYAQDLDPSAFLAQTLVDIYPEKDYHRLYIGEIAKVLAK